ncbi:hypothetical protein DUG50_22775 [Salmonella enterica subsp. enterica serovar Miami]|nr:hypothetical protein [Salmonella enterica subsp. enterica serovar Miami]
MSNVPPWEIGEPLEWPVSLAEIERAERQREREERLWHELNQPPPPPKRRYVKTGFYAKHKPVNPFEMPDLSPSYYTRLTQLRKAMRGKGQ